MSKPRHRLRRLNLRTVTLVTAVLVAALVAWASIGIYQTVATQRTTEVQRDGAAAQAVSLAEQIKQACASGDLTGAVCQQAVEIAADPVPVEPPVVGASQEQIDAAVDARIDRAVAAYIAAHPPADGRSPTTEELTGLVATAVTSFLNANPPADGRSATPAEIGAEVQRWFVDNPIPAGPEGQPGAEGEKGDKGDPPSQEQIDTAVAAALAANPPPAGPQGVGIQSVTTEDRPEGCFLVFTLVDPANPSTPTTQDVPVADGVCDDLP